MLVVKAEIWPHGNRDASYEVGRLEIANTGLSLGGMNSYWIKGQTRPWTAMCIPERFAAGYLENFNREQPVWEIVLAALNALKGKWG